MNVDIWSDIACPWCFIGKRRFERAVDQFREQRPDVDFAVTYHSFELSPETPQDFVGSPAEFLAKHRGLPEAQAQAMFAQVTELALAEGLRYRYDEVKQVNTLRVHRVLHLALEQGVQIQAKERFLAAFFEEGRNLADEEELVRLGQEVGLGEEAIRASLRDPAYADAVQQDITRAKMLGVSGVPFFMLDNKYGVSGAQESANFVAVFEQVLALEAQEGQNAEGAERTENTGSESP